MGRIKELQDLISKGEATEEQVAELETLKSEAGEAVAVEKQVEAEEAAGVEKLADAIAAKAFEKLSSKLESEVKEEKKEEVIESKPAKAVVKTYIVDKTLGKVTPDELDGHKEVISERKAAGKHVTEISARTKHWVGALINNDVQKLQVLTEGTAAAGGYLVPEDFMNMIVEDLRDATVMRQIASQMNTTTDTVHLPRLDTRPQAAWRSEAAAKLTSTAQFSELVFTPYSIASIVTLSQELVDDASLGVGGSIVNYIAGLITRAIAEKEDQAFFRGDGSGKPTGVMNYSLSSTTTTGPDGIITAFYALKQGYRSNATYVANAQTIATIRKFKDTTNQYLVTNLAGSPNQLLLGRPIYEQNDIPNGVLLFGDFSYYQIVDRQGISVRVSDEATVGSGGNAFEKNLVHIRVEKRVDAELTLTEAVAKVQGL